MNRSLPSAIGRTRRLSPDQLRAIPLFAGQDDESLAELARRALPREYSAGELVVLEGTQPPGLFLVDHGWLKVVKIAPSGREQTLRFIEPGETFNEVGVFTSRPTPATVIALEPAGVWLLPRALLLAWIEEQPGFAQHAIANLAERMLHLVGLVTDLSLRKVTERIAHLLLESAIDGVLDRPRWFTQAELAARLGTVPDVVQRALREIEGSGAIVVERHRIVIKERDALEAISDGT